MRFWTLVSVDMSNAYPIDISSFTRRFVMHEQKIVLTDTFDSSLNVRERFVTEIEPVIDDENNIIIAGAKLSASLGWSVSLSAETRCRHDGKTERKIYILDFITEEVTDNFKMEIIFV